ncbi:MAG: DUF3501 family protein [Acidobacteriota bacterium]
MKLVELSEIKSIPDYEAEREALRPKMIEVKNRRRIRVGDHLTFLFENRDTVRYQVQEMIRIERITGATEIGHELETYNELIPAQGELSASLLIEYETPAERDVHLKQLLGLDKHIWIEAGGERSGAIFDGRQIGETRLSSVQYVKFKLTEKQMAAWETAKIVVDHSYYSFARELTTEERNELAADFA